MIIIVNSLQKLTYLVVETFYFLDFINVLFQVTFGGEDSDGWRFDQFLIDGGVPPQPAYYGKHSGPKISKIDSFTKNISPERLFHLNSFFVWIFRIMAETCRISFGYWWLLQFSATISLKTKPTFLHIFKYVSASCLYQFTLCNIYYIFYIYKIYIIHYIIKFTLYIILFSCFLEVSPQKFKLTNYLWGSTYSV